MSDFNFKKLNMDDFKKPQNYDGEDEIKTTSKFKLDKKKIIIISVAVGVLIIGLLIGLFACGSNNEPVEELPPAPTCKFHFDADFDYKCDKCDFVFAKPEPEPAYDPAADKSKAVNSINNFFKSNLDLAAPMTSRAEITNVRIRNRMNANDTSIDPGVQKILISNNVAYIQYKKAVGDNKITSEYFVMKPDGYYVLQQSATGYEYLFKTFSMPDFSKFSITEEDITYNTETKVFEVSSEYLKKFAIDLFVSRTNILDNFIDRSLDATQLRKFINQTTMTAYFRVDEKTGNITELNFVSKLNQNGYQKDIIYFTATMDESTIYCELKNYYNTNEMYTFKLTKEIDESYSIAFETYKYNMLGERSEQIGYSCSIKQVADNPILLQPEIEEEFLVCDRLFSVYNTLNNKYNRKVVVNATYCEKVYVYDNEHRVYARYFKQDDNYVFGGFQVHVIEKDICMGQFASDRKTINIVEHGSIDAWRDEIAAKYANPFLADAALEHGCDHVYLYDNEYEVNVFFVRTGNYYKMVGYDKNNDNAPFFCSAKCSIETNVLSITRHSNYEKLVNALKDGVWGVAGNQSAACYKIAVWNSTIEQYIIFNVNGSVATFDKIQPYADGLCIGRLYVDTYRIEISKHNH
jgi:hypothetical protein